jgi:poly-gamma-glutamate capsule biosynthesis protein CapA/YwtB (metallophosphatase superfamily)
MLLALTGDVMLGRMVNESVVENRAVRPETLWGDLLPVMRRADCRLINLECVISDRGMPWHPNTKAFHFRAGPRAVEVLRAAGIDGVMLANNHVLDYGEEAFLDCLRRLNGAGLTHAGAGASVEEALAPAVFHIGERSLALVALTDNEPEWEATHRKPGVNYVAYNDRGLLAPYRQRIAQALSLARRQADVVMVSAHVGPNWGAPSRAMRALAHELIEMGADLYWGHSNHPPQGIELYHGKPILYSAGDFVDDYMVDSAERNDLSFLFLVEVEENRIRQILLHPIRIENCRVRRANERESTFLARTMQAKCAAFETSILFREGVGTVTIA